MKKKIHAIKYIFKREWTWILRDEAVLTFFVALTLMYPIVYTCIYTNETVHEVPVAVVDHSASSAAREFVRRWDATSGVWVIARCTDMEEARRLWWQKEVYGIMEIPTDFARRIGRGEQAHLSLYCDMGGLLNYKALLQAASDVAVLMGKEIQVAGLPYASVKQEDLTASPVKMTEVKLFNPQSGYASFIIPAILILVIQQSLLLGVGTIAGTERERNKRGMLIPPLRYYRNPFSVTVGKALAYFPVYALVSVWIFVVVPGIFNLTRIGHPGDLFLFLLPFLLGCIFLAQTLSFLCREREMPFLIFVFTSVPLMFMSGLSWPVSAIPDYWVAFSQLFPSTHGIEGFVKINNMGADLREVYPQFYRLWILTAVYFTLACLLYYREIKKVKTGTRPRI